MSRMIEVEASWSTPVGAVIRFEVDEIRMAGVDVTDSNAVERWCEDEARRLIMRGDVEPTDWSNSDTEIIECWATNGEVDLDDMTEDERAKVEGEQ